MNEQGYLEKLAQLGFRGTYLQRARQLAGQPPLLAVYKTLQLAVEKKNMLPDEALALVENALHRGTAQTDSGHAEVPAGAPAPAAGGQTDHLIKKN